MKRILSLMVIFFTVQICFSQGKDLHFFTGINYGGPLPQSKMEGSTGKPKIGINAGVGYTKKISEYFSLFSELQLSYKAIEYASNYTRDTMVKITIMGESGEVPSYYTAFVKGKMNFLSLELPLLLSYNIKHTRIMFGPYASQIIAGEDEGKVRIMIGDGGFYDDYYQDFNNNSSIHKTDFGAMFTSMVPLFSKIMLEIKASRSIRPLYKKGFFSKNGNPENKLFNTYFYLSLAYRMGT